MSTTAVKLTPKQQQVIEALDRGEAPPAIAKKMKISASGVYGHIRNIRKLGIVIPGESLGSNGDGPTADAEPLIPPGGYTPSAEDEAPAVDAETFLEGEVARAQADLAKLGDDHAALTESLAQTAAKQTELVERIEKLDAARMALN